MNTQQKREELVRLFKERLQNQMAEAKEVDDSQLDLLETEMQRTTFTLRLLEEGKTEFNGEEISLSDKKIELMYREYIDPSA